MTKYDNEDGVWRTIGGRRVFIKDGEDLASAMKRSGKFKSSAKIKQLYSDTWNAKKDYNELKEELNKMKKSGEATSKDIEKAKLEAQEEYNKGSAIDTHYAKLTQTGFEKDLEERKERIDNNTATQEDKDYYERGKKTYDRYYGKENEDKEEKIKLSEKQIEAGNKLNTKAEKGARDDISQYLRGNNEDFANDEEFVKALSEEWAIDKDRANQLLAEGKSIETNKSAGQKFSDTLKDNKVKTFGDEIKENETKALGRDLKDLNNGKYTIDYFKNKGVEIKDKAPEGWQKLEGATTAPNGYEWYSNGKSRFGGEYKNALVKKQDVSKTSEVKVKGENNVIPRDFEKGYGRFKVKTTASDKLEDRFEITKDENGFHAKNLRTGETYATFREHLSNNNVFEFENTNSNQITNSLQQKAYQKYLKEHPNSKMTFNQFKKMK